jgi:hypothetical protein
MAKKVEKTRNGNTWTEARYFQQIRSFMRKAFMYYIPIQKALENAPRPYTGEELKKNINVIVVDNGKPEKVYK